MHFVLRKNHYNEMTVFPFLTCTLIKHLFDNLIDLYIYLYPYSMTVMEWEKKNWPDQEFNPYCIISV